jgi:hypothetical protein
MSTFILDGHKAVPCVDLHKWSTWFETADRHVGLTLKNGVGVSTVFLGIGRAFEDSSPLLFATTIFGGAQDGYQTRCATWEEAEAMHKEGCKVAFGAKV